MNKYVIVAKEATDDRPKPLFFSIKAIDGTHEVDTINKATWFGDPDMAVASYRSFHNGMRGAEAIHRRYRVMSIKDAYAYTRDPRKYRVEEVAEPVVPTITIVTKTEQIKPTTTERNKEMNNDQNNNTTTTAPAAEQAKPVEAQPQAAEPTPGSTTEAPKAEQPAAPAAEPVPGASNPDELHKQVNEAAKKMSTTKKVVIGSVCVVALAAIGVGAALLLNRGGVVAAVPETPSV